VSARELETFLATWDHEARSTVRLLQALPADQYEFRPDPTGRSLGELAWHLAEIDAYMGNGAAHKVVDFSTKLAGLERPKAIAALAPGYQRVHEEFAARVRAMKPEDMDAMMPFMGRTIRVGELLWSVLLHHAIHHRGQLALMCRLAGGVAPGLYGPNREDMAAMRGA
jgi:uncharacterized damage-inducible protein DinB